MRQDLSFSHPASYVMKVLFVLAATSVSGAKNNS